MSAHRDNATFIIYVAVDGSSLDEHGPTHPITYYLLLSADTIGLNINIVGPPHYIGYKYISAHPILSGISAEISRADNIGHLSNSADPILSDPIC